VTVNLGSATEMTATSETGKRRGLHPLDGKIKLNKASVFLSDHVAQRVP